MQFPHNAPSIGGVASIIPQQLHNGSEIAIKAFTHPRQHRVLSNRCTQGNKSVMSAGTGSKLLIWGLAEAGWNRHRHTRHLGGKTASNKIFLKDLKLKNCFILALRFGCTTAGSPPGIWLNFADDRRSSADGRIHTWQWPRQPRR